MNIRTGNANLDAALGGGYPNGITAIAGHALSGKSTMCYDAIVRCQTHGGVAAVVSPYFGVTPAPAHYLNREAVAHHVPRTIEDALDYAVTLAMRADLVVLDDVLYLPAVGDSMGACVRALHVGLPELASVAIKRGVSILITSNTKCTPGGGTIDVPYALLYMSRVVLRLEPGLVHVTKNSPDLPTDLLFEVPQWVHAARPTPGTDRLRARTA